MAEMTKETKRQLEELTKKMEEAGNRFDLALIDKHLARYHDFVLDIRNRLEEVVDEKTFRSFRNEWKECGGIARLPEELAAFHEYQALAERYNAIVMPLLTRGIDTQGYLPIFIGQAEFDVYQNETPLYQRPFNWEKLKERLVGPATRNAIYIHAVACMEPDAIISMVEDKSIKLETIQALPYAVSVRGVNAETNARLYQKHYHEHLAAVYDHFGFVLPKIIVREEPLKGVTFEGRPEKIRYILQHIEDPCDSKSLSLKAEKYIFEKDGVKEPAIRVICTIPGDRQFKDICIGNLDRNLAIAIEEKHKEATLALDLKEIGIFETASESGTARNPYAKLILQIADKPQEKERSRNKDYSNELDAMFNMDELK